MFGVVCIGGEYIEIRVNVVGNWNIRKNVRVCVDVYYFGVCWIVY